MARKARARTARRLTRVLAVLRTMRAFIPMLLLSGSLILPACSIHARDEGLLQRLAMRRQQILARATSEPTVFEGDIDLQNLVGVPQESLLKALGMPDACGHDLGSGGVPAFDNCLAVSEWVYAFYWLPPGSRGGGPELWIKFDQHSRCEMAQWHFTR